MTSIGKLRKRNLVRDAKVTSVWVENGRITHINHTDREGLYVNSSTGSEREIDLYPSFLDVRVIKLHFGRTTVVKEDYLKVAMEARRRAASRLDYQAGDTERARTDASLIEALLNYLASGQKIEECPLTPHLGCTIDQKKLFIAAAMEKIAAK